MLFLARLYIVAFVGTWFCAGFFAGEYSHIAGVALLGFAWIIGLIISATLLFKKGN